MNNQPQEYYTPYQLKFPIEIEKIIETTDPVYTFCEVMNHMGRPKVAPHFYSAVQICIISQCMA